MLWDINDVLLADNVPLPPLRRIVNFLCANLFKSVRNKTPMASNFGKRSAGSRYRLVTDDNELIARLTRAIRRQSQFQDQKAVLNLLSRCDTKKKNLIYCAVHTISFKLLANCVSIEFREFRARSSRGPLRVLKSAAKHLIANDI